MANNFYAIYPPISGGVANNPSVGPNGSTAPTSSTEIGFIDGGGLLQGVSAANPLPVDIVIPMDINVNLAEVAGTATATGLGASNGGTQRVALSSDSSLDNITGTISLPTGASTAANQATIISDLAAIEANQTNGTQVTTITGTVPLPTGAATAANQVTQESTLTAIQANQTNGAQVTTISGNVTVVQSAGSNLHVDIDSSVLPTGASTLAAQTNVQSAPGTPQSVAITVQGNASGVPLPISGTVTITPSGEQNVNLNQVGGSAISIGQQLSAASLPVVLPAAQITTLTPPTTVTVIQPTAANLNATVVTTGGSTIAEDAHLTNVQSAPGTSQTVAVTIQGNASGIAVPISGTVGMAADIAPATQNITAQDTVSTSTTQADGQIAITGTPTAGSIATFSISSEQSVEAQVTGTWTGTLSSEMSFDGGTTWFTRGLKLAGASYLASTFTQNFQGGANITGVTNYRIRSTAAWTGTAVVKVVLSLNNSSVTVSNPLTLRDSTTQSIANTIKAASTAAVATDTALVVALSPNSNTVVATPAALPGTPLTGQKTSTGTAVAISATSQPLTNGVIVQALSTNAGLVYIGGSGVLTTTGFQLQPGQATSTAVNNLNEVYVISVSSGDGVCFIGS